ncbi:DUF2913 family protein [Erwinia sp. S38]|uniref:DUF2913 family protein n=1 Tax=Erwinia sp. S38 TaxID=2769338 RepID=UPI00190B4164|nr:DUF2913 family protein [Erwinia sp. S38]MBK0004294.1 DUF2913 family protein [Erwinia sp. S38]
MDNRNLNVSHLAWCGLVALQNARNDGQVSSPAQENLFLVRWLALAEKQRRFHREFAEDIRWLLKTGRNKGVHADLPGKLNYLWRAGSGSLKEQNDLFRLQHALQAVKLTGWVYRVLSVSEWSGRNRVRLNPCVSGMYLNKAALDNGFDETGTQRSPLPVRITGNLAGLDELLKQSGWRREPVAGDDAQLHHLLASQM